MSPRSHLEMRWTLRPPYAESVDADFYHYQEFWCSFLISRRNHEISQQHFQAQPVDIILSSAPETGTTWLKVAIVTGHHFDGSTNSLLTIMPHECVPLLEVDSVQDPFHRSPNLSLLATHMPYTSLEPKDAFVSLWHFICKLAPQEGEHVPLEKAPDMFCKGISEYGPYWDHVVRYWKASLECPERVLFLKYEVYFSKGNVGDWNNYPDELVQCVVQITEHKFSGTGLMFLQP
ncbi:hypothetical protein VitviT2T_028563 [Vitis vinifera]|uniref:Sulfotransferase n=1 Tax=Vitis vinifera TaxID=29760 RepID=A0ABY9DU02_VITVI|nr:hypothetical protein VitviT2T_028563 [Vitis vinifera]